MSRTGARLNLRGLPYFQKKLEQFKQQFPRKVTLVVGWDGTCRYPDGKYVADVARLQEYGGYVPAPKSWKSRRVAYVPPRPMLRLCEAANKNKWLALVKKDFKTALTDPSMTTEKALLRVALVMQGDLKNTINSIWTPPLSPYTVKMRHWRRTKAGQSYGIHAIMQGMDLKPLEDTGVMIGSVTYFLRTSPVKEEA